MINLKIGIIMENSLTLGYSIIIPKQKQTVNPLGNDYASKLNEFRAYAESIYNPELDYTVNPLIKKENDGNKRKCYLLTTNVRNNKDEDFKGSNVVFIDIDDTKDETIKAEDKIYNYYHKISSQITASQYYIFNLFPNLIAYQKSYSGGMHLIFEIPFCKTIEEWNMYSQFQHNYFKKEFLAQIPLFNKIADEIAIDKYIDNHTEDSINQKLFVCKNKIVFNQNEINLDCFSEVVSNQSSYIIHTLVKEDDQNETTFDENSDTEESESPEIEKIFKNKEAKPFEEFLTNETIPELDNRINLQYDINKSEVYRITKYLADTWNNVFMTYTKYLRAGISEEAIYNVRLVPFILRDDEGNIQRIQQGGGEGYLGRRYNIMSITKIAILNAYATMKYYNLSQIDLAGIHNTISWYINNCIEVNGHSRFIDDDIIKECIKSVYYRWSDINLIYRPNSGWCNEKKCEGEDIMVFLQRYGAKVRKMKFTAVELTVLSFIKDNNLAGKSGKCISDLLIKNNIATKTSKYKWTEKSVNRILAKFNLKVSTDNYLDRLEELYSEGKKYVEIANILNSEGYTTKQGKEFNKQQIKNIVSRNLKNNNTNMEETIETKKPAKEVAETNQGLDITQRLMLEAQLFFNNHSVIDLIPSVSSYTELANKVSYNIKKI